MNKEEQEQLENNQEPTDVPIVEGEILKEEEADEEAVEETEIDLEKELAEARAEAAEYLDGWQRAQAEFSNYKKRQEADRAQMIAMANAALLRRLLPIVDDFERALDAMPEDVRSLAWSEGVALIRQKLDTLLASEDVQPIETEGQVFDPRFHEAVTYEEAEGYEEGQIIAEAQRGYILGERVLRPALVRVAKGPSQPVQPSEQQFDSSEEQGAIE